MNEEKKISAALDNLWEERNYTARNYYSTEKMNDSKMKKDFMQQECNSDGSSD